MASLFDDDDEEETPEVDLFADDDEDEVQPPPVRVRPSLVPSLFDTETVEELKSRILELEAALAASEARCLSLEAALRSETTEDETIAMDPRRRRVEAQNDDPYIFAAYEKPRRRPRRPPATGTSRRLKPLKRERALPRKREETVEILPEDILPDLNDLASVGLPSQQEAPLPSEEEEEEDDEDVSQREDDEVRAWASTKQDVVAMLSSLGDILPKALVSDLDDLATSKAVRRAYFKVARRCHPDKSRNLPRDLRFRAQFVFSALTEALSAYDEND